MVVTEITTLLKIILCFVKQKSHWEGGTFVWLVVGKLNELTNDFFPFKKKYELTEANDYFLSDLVNRNDFSPNPGEGENGRPVVIPPREFLKMQQQFKINSYNLLASDRITLNRSLPDVRKKK